MVHHIVTWKLKASFSAQEREKALAFLMEKVETLKKIPGVADFETTTRINPKTTIPADFILHSSHETQDALKEYYDHPVHLEFVAAVKGIIDFRELLDFEI
ncbi:Dabb family protein [Desulfovibrio sp. OttesenSCG-928-C06]|nr:Dabb family protein [Desulfovibrio sp. OttesenSCG-928-C06]